MVLRRLLSSSVFLAFFLVATVARAQDASVIGTVTDETKSVLPGATVTATNLETGRQTSSVTDERGSYRLLRMPPGKYKVQAELQGFSSVVFPQVELLVGQNATVPFVLKIASVSETLTITAESPLVDVASSQVAGNVDRRQMEQMPLQGRNWMELSKLVKGITANDVTNTPGVGSDDMFQLNLDGQQITQKIAGSGFGQPRFSREAIAEFQIITNMFDITQGRSAGIQVQAISKSGTNTHSGSFYGFFRDDSLNAADAVAKKVLPYANQQIGGTFGGPIIKDKLHFFASYEYEREPGTFFSSPSTLPGQTFTVPYKNGQKSFLARVDDQLSANNRLSFRGSRWTWSNPFVLGTNGHPSNSSVQTKAATNILGSWSHINPSSNKVHEIKVGYNNFDWTNAPQPSMVGYPQYDFPGLTLGAPYNFPQHPVQNNFESRYDLNWHKNTHDIKIGAEYIYVKHTGDWYIQTIGRYTMSAVPNNLASLIPVDAALDPSRWNISGLSPFVSRADINYSYNGWEDIIDSPRPTYAIWFGDNWRVSNQLTVNYGVRWDADPNTASAKNVKTNSIPINPGYSYGEYVAGGADYGYKTGIHDWKDIAPRVGFTYNVGGKNDFVIRGGSGLYFASPVSNVTFSPGVYSNLITATFPNDGRADFISNPTNGISGDAFLNGTAPLPAQSPRVIVDSFLNPYTWQSSIGFQKQLNAVTGIEADLTHYDEYRDTRSIDANLTYNAATGYNSLVSAGRPNKAYGQVLAFTSDGRKDQTQVSMGLTRRLQKKFQAGLTYTVMVDMHDNGTLGYTNPTANNPFDYLDGEYARSTEFQRNTIRAWTLYQMPWGISTSVSYFYGSGNRFAASIAATPYGKTGTNRLNASATGGASPTITVPAAVAERFNGPAVITSGMVIPRNALEGLPLHKVDLRLTKDFKIHGSLKASLIGEVFNLFNHANYGSYNTSLSPTNAATTALFGSPAQNTNNAYVPRTGQLAFRVAF
jgi:Carboxypeptidase regulatory-like domain